LGIFTLAELLAPAETRLRPTYFDIQYAYAVPVAFLGLLKTQIKEFSI
jgi:hypothetical protein